jgi:hypothetical protein
MEPSNIPSGISAPACKGMRGSLAATSVAILFAVLLLIPVTASAKQQRLFAGTFGSATSIPADPYPLLLEASQAEGVAVDDVTHDVYVSDVGNHRVEKFTASGEFLLAFGADVGGPGVNVCGGLVSCAVGTSGSAPGQLTDPAFVAVDNSTGPSKGDVYVADGADDTVSKFDGSGDLVSSWGKEGQFDGSSVTKPPAPLRGPFETIFGIAVDPSGNLWVHGSAEELTNGLFQPKIRMFEFKQDSTLITDFRVEASALSDGIAVDSEDDLYFVSNGAEEYNSIGNEIGTISVSGNGGLGGHSIAVDPTNKNIYLGTGKVEDGEVTFFDDSCHPVPDGVCTPTEFFGSGYLGIASPVALAVDPVSQTVYALPGEGAGYVASFVTATVPDVDTVAPSSPTFTSATLNGVVNPDGVTLREGLEGCRFEWGETIAYGRIAPCAESAAQIGMGVGPVSVHANITGLSEGKTYHFRLVAGNANDVNEHVNEPSVGQDVRLGPPLVDDESVLGVTGTSATVRALVDPQNVDTQLQVEYGTDVSYGRSTSSVDIGAGAVDRGFSEHLQGLASGTLYHYRVVASSALGTSRGEDHTFTTQSVGEVSPLPDDREWELVSPPEKHGGLLLPIEQEGMVQAAASGGAISYMADAPTEADTHGAAGISQVLSVRGAGGWSSRDLSASHSRATGVPLGQGHEYRFFSSDLSLSVLQPFGVFEPALSDEASEQTPYVRSDYDVRSSGFCTESCYRPLLTTEDVTSDAPFGTCSEPCAAAFVGATPGLSHVVLKSDVGLTSVQGDKGGLYEYSEGHLVPVSVLPDGAPAEPGDDPKLGFGDRVARGAISADGSRVFWSVRIGGLTSLFLRYNATREQSAVDGSGRCTEPERACTIQLDVPRGGSGVGSPDSIFQFAPEDGTRVFFTDTQSLTQDSAPKTEADLYECRIEDVAGGPRCGLTDLTPAIGGESGDVVGTLPGASEDGSYVYFVAKGVLTGVQANERGETASAGQSNLYLRHEEVTTFIATLSVEDGPDWGRNDNSLAELTSRVSLDGRWFAFMSQRPLTGYDSRDAVSGKPDEEVFLYHSTGSGTGKLVCASCNSTGARPHGVEYGRAGEPHLPLVGGFVVWPGSAWIAANIPGWTPYQAGEALYQSRYLSDGGRLFFNASDALVPQDTNGAEDVYEYEPSQGEGSPSHDGCSKSDPGFVAAGGGCVSLVSSGSSPEESAFVDASETGDDVFFLTSSRLSTLDFDGALDVYDAHVCSGESSCPPSPVAPAPECQGDACQAPAVSPEALTPSSLTFSGPGNISSPAPVAVVTKAKPSVGRAQKLAGALRVCRKKKAKRKRLVCEKRAKKAFGSVVKANKSRKGAGK